MRLRYLSIYETAAHFYIVGCDASQTKYHLLKVDRMDPRCLAAGESDNEYSKSDIQELLATITEGSSILLKSQPEKKSNSKRKGLTERVGCAYGLLGAVRFLEGYYLVLVTRARIVASFGYHAIYKIEEVTMLYIFADGLPMNPDEQRYVKLFQSVDLTTDFYFSYTYDLSRTLQENCCEVRGWPNCKDAFERTGRSFSTEDKFIWNRFLLEPLRSNLVSEKWLIEIVHGYVGQQIIELPCSRVSITLIGRRSSVYAGTRYLKRGANQKGDVANDVETEQIVWDMSSSPDFCYGKFSAFVQRRGSVPLLWSQDPSTRGVVGKPLISIDINEPHAQTAAAHFRELRKKYGSPLIVMNLVKRREKRKHEAVLHDQFIKAVRYLNQFLIRRERILYLSFDVARCNKTGIVMSKLEEIGLKAVLRHGWFQSFPLLYCREVRPNVLLAEYVPYTTSNGRYILQRGVSRTNCVDCLDRTNVVQFGIGKVALGMQLYSMGFCGEPVLSLSSEVCRIFEDLMDEHGDTMALQYAGSQLVHSIKTYKKTAAFQERSRDVIQTLSRYYSNTFGDYDKLNAINLFLGIFRPCQENQSHLWELGTDYYLHFPSQYSCKGDYCAWYCDPESFEDGSVQECCSAGTDESLETGIQNIECSTPTVTPDVEVEVPLYSVNARLRFSQNHLSVEEQYYAHYRLWEVTNFDELIREQKDLQKSVTVDGIQQSVAQSYSFAKLWKMPETDAKSKITVTKSEKASLIEDDDEEDEPIVKSDAEVHYECEFNNLPIERRRVSNQDGILDFNFTTRYAKNTSHRSDLSVGLRTCAEAYGFEMKTPSDADLLKYRRYAEFAENEVLGEVFGSLRSALRCCLRIPAISDYSSLKLLSLFTMDSAFQCELPEVSKVSLKRYAESVECCHSGPKEPTTADRYLYNCYRPSDEEVKPSVFQAPVKTAYGALIH